MLCDSINFFYHCVNDSCAGCRARIRGTGLTLRVRLHNLNFAAEIFMQTQTEPDTPLRTASLTKGKRIAFALVAFVALVIAMELVARFMLGNAASLSLKERRTRFEPYQNKSWTEQYFKDEEECGRQRNVPTSTSPYVRYLLHDIGFPGCETETANLLDGNKRGTWEPNALREPGARKVYRIGIFGGSTVQGVGVPDDLTIPSQFSMLANTASSAALYRVENYGVSAYTYTQSILKLALLLREGERFDYVILYNGANDIDNAYTEGSAGALYGEKTIVINRLYGGLWGQLKNVLRDQFNACALCRLGITVARNTPLLREYITPSLIRLRRFTLFQEGATKDDAGLDRFAEEIAAYYGKSHDLLDKLATAYGFRYAEFWQPSLLYEDGPVGGEKIYWGIDNRLTDEKLKTLYRSTLAHVRALELPHFYDLSQSLVGRTKAYYLDAVHLADDGNREVAERMFENIGAELPR